MCLIRTEIYYAECMYDTYKQTQLPSSQLVWGSLRPTPTIGKKRRTCTPYMFPIYANLISVNLYKVEVSQTPTARLAFTIYIVKLV